MSSEVLYERRGPVAWITLNRPQKLNALNEAVVKQHLLEPGYFEPTPQWNTDRSNDRLWS